MAFNAQTYRINRLRRDRDKALAEAREMKVRIAAGDCYEWERDRVKWNVDRARHASTMLRLELKLRAIHRGEA